MSKIKLFTHTDLDGIGCAILAYLAFGRENVDIEYCDYSNVNDKVGEFWENGPVEEYDKVFITDISIGIDLARTIDLYAGDDIWHLFDHHNTAIYLNAYDWCQVLDVTPLTHIKTCGTELFYRYLHVVLDKFPNTDTWTQENIQKFVETVRDWDTWRWKELGEEGIVCKQVNDLFDIYGREKFIDWIIGKPIRLEYMRKFPNFTITEWALLKQKQKDIDRYVEEKSKQLFHRVDEVGHTYGVVFAERYFSELGNRLCELNTDLAYIAMIDISSGTVSYRTIRDDIDVGGEIAHAYGGGGHPKAAGSTFDKDQIQRTVHGLIFSDKQHNEL